MNPVTDAKTKSSQMRQELIAEFEIVYIMLTPRSLHHRFIDISLKNIGSIT